jgi:UDP-N-acetyl-D-glucosamine dehydrogenase
MTALTEHAAMLRERIINKQAQIAVIGCGYVGLPLAVRLAETGFRVAGIDLDEQRVRTLRDGRSPIMDVSQERLEEQLESGRFRASSDYDELREADVIFVTVPTPFDRAKQPDLRFVVAAAEGIASRLRTRQLVILESTTFPGTTDEVMRPILERGGLKAGADFYLAFSPERIDPGNREFGIHNTPKVVGGVDEQSAELAGLVLEQIVESGKIHLVSSARVAEMTKLLENTFRAVNIALVNELAMLCDRMDINVWEVIEAAATKPYGFMPFYPGPGVGGHCIPVDPYYLAWKAREFDFQTRFIELAAETNQTMPFFAVTRIRRLLNHAGSSVHGAQILVLGAAFKKDIDDPRNSPAVRVMEILRSEGAHVQYHDALVPEVTLADTLFAKNGLGTRMRSVDLNPNVVAGADCVVILVGHSRVDYDMVLAKARLVFDCVNVTSGRQGRAVVERL